jgi:hypothetical protein
MPPKDRKSVDAGPDSKDEAIAAALKIFGIPEQYVLSAKCDPEAHRVTIVTHGGKRVSWSGEEDIRPLTRIEITGVNPENARRKPITGGKPR